MNDSLKTNIFVRFEVETIACACVYLAARQVKVIMEGEGRSVLTCVCVQIPLPESQPCCWWKLFDVHLRDLKVL